MNILPILCLVLGLTVLEVCGVDLCQVDPDITAVATESFNCTRMQIIGDATAIVNSTSPVVICAQDVIIGGYATLEFIGARHLVITDTMVFFQSTYVKFDQLEIRARWINISDTIFDGKGRIVNGPISLSPGFPGYCSACGGEGGYHSVLGGMRNPDNPLSAVPRTYDNPYAPNATGSMGGWACNNGGVSVWLGGAGGGFLKLWAELIQVSTQAQFTVDGTYGLTDANTNNYYGGGGSGGSIFFKTRTIVVSDIVNGSPSFRAFGGTSSQGGGGAGGNIMMMYEDHHLESSLYGQASGGSSGIDHDGQAGTFITQGDTPYEYPPPCGYYGPGASSTSGSDSSDTQAGTTPPTTQSSSSSTPVSSSSSSTSTSTSTSSSPSSTTTAAATLATTTSPSSTTATSQASSAAGTDAGSSTSSPSSSASSAASSSASSQQGDAVVSGNGGANNSEGSSGAIIASVIVLILVVLVAVGVLVVVVRRRKAPSGGKQPSSAQQEKLADESGAQVSLGRREEVTISSAPLLLPSPERTIVTNLPSAIASTTSANSLASATTDAPTIVTTALSAGSRSSASEFPSVRSDAERGAERTSHYNFSQSHVTQQINDLVGAPSSTLLGSGMTADVFRVKYAKQWVAVKCFKTASQAALDEFHAEVAVFTRVAEARHEHVLGMHFICSEPKMHAIVVDLADGGSMQSVVEGSLTMTAAARRAALAGVASGMAFLHLQGVVHLDLKPANVLRMKNGSVKVADFGASAVVSDLSDEITTTAFVGTLQYAAPERLLSANRIHLKPTDVYSFGATCWSVLAGQIPFAGTPLAQVASKAASEPASTLFPVQWAENADLHALILACCDKDHSRRPAFDNLRPLLE